MWKDSGGRKPGESTIVETFASVICDQQVGPSQERGVRQEHLGTCKVPEH